ncbi:uncharacterized protein Sse [Prorops nasuta]|uniref:uncharacterized protein Sse n=1 Tax=Prorops nasuta TaxID=863751 RepID=UPI0034CF5A74
MSDVIGNIIQILDESEDYEELDKDLEKSVKADSLEKLKNDTKELFNNGNCNMSSNAYSSLNKMLGVCNLTLGKEIEALNYIIDSHSVILRQHGLNRFIKTDIRQSVLKQPQACGLNFECIKNNAKKHSNAIQSTTYMLAELPTEWYIIQITQQYESPLESISKKSMPECMHPIHITMLPTGTKTTLEPFCITLPKPEMDTNYDICSEIHTLLDSNKSYLESAFFNSHLYLMMREKQNNKMKTAVDALELVWLREWRVLLMADPIEQLDLVNNIHEMIEKLILDNNLSKTLSNCTKWLLKKIAVGSCFLKREEIALAVKQVLPTFEKLADQIILSIYGQTQLILNLRTVKRLTLVLIIDERIDFIPFEAMEIINQHPVTRFPSLHIAYALFKEHKATMSGGCKVIKLKHNMGTSIVNAASNLPKMEKRMKLFLDYWLPDWTSLYSEEPDRKFFEDALVNKEILLYCGHGNGIQYLPGQEIEKLRVKAIVFLFGCSSVKLLNVGGRFPPHGISDQYLIASSPCILGMLWEITDTDVDRVTTNFMSSWIPSKAKKPWSDVNADAWCSGTFKFKSKSKKDTSEMILEPEMLRVIAKSKHACQHYMTSAAIIVRGLPVRIE